MAVNLATLEMSTERICVCLRVWQVQRPSSICEMSSVTPPSPHTHTINTINQVELLPLCSI